MKSESQEIFEFVLNSLQQGRQACLVSVVETFGSSPRPVGSLLALDSAGHFKGSVSGGCVEEQLIETLQSNMPAFPELLIYGGSEEERSRLKLPCGGHLRLMIEPVSDINLVQQLIEVLHKRQTVQWQTDLQSGAQSFTVAEHSAEIKLLEQQWRNSFGPQWRMFVIGAGPIARYLVDMASSLDISSCVIDPRPEYQQDWNTDLAPLIAKYPDDVFVEHTLDEHSLVVALSHDPKLDDLAIMAALHSKAKYIGAMGSARTSAARRKRLIDHFDFTEQSLQKLKAPIGLDIGSKTPVEIAVSVLADIIAVKNGKDFK